MANGVRVSLATIYGEVTNTRTELNTLATRFDDHIKTEESQQKRVETQLEAVKLASDTNRAETAKFLGIGITILALSTIFGPRIVSTLLK